MSLVNCIEKPPTLAQGDLVALMVQKLRLLKTGHLENGKKWLKTKEESQLRHSYSFWKMPCKRQAISVDSFIRRSIRPSVCLFVHPSFSRFSEGLGGPQKTCRTRGDVQLSVHFTL